MPVLTPTPRSASSANAQYVSLDLSKLQPGSKLRAPIWDDGSDRDVLLLAAGTVLSASSLELLRARGIRNVRVHRSDVARLTGTKGTPDRYAASGKGTREPDRDSASHWGTTSDSFVHQVVRHGTRPYDSGQVERNAAAFRKSVSSMRHIFEGMANGDLNSAPELATVASSALSQISSDLDLFVSLGLVPAHDSYCGQHSLQTAMLAMSIGTVLGLRKEELVELAIGCLIHDAGMLRLRGSATELPRELSTLEFLEVTKHPSITYDLLRDLREVSVGSRHVAYQMHERCDGSGYPRKRTAPQIHPLAKIAAVADVFHALVSPRPWRPSVLPYEAMKRIILDTRRGLFDSDVVRALLKTVSLFPIGSCVETNDGRVGKVVRSNGDQYTRPVLELWTPGARDESTRIVNLAEADGLEIRRALDEPPVELPTRKATSSAATASQADAAAALDHWE